MIKNIGSIDSLIRDAVNNNDIPGASYSFISKDEVSTHYIGYQKNNPRETPLRPNMIYDLASVTKVVGTTTRIFQLLGEKIISLNDPVVKFLPDWPYKNITIENLLMHNSGLPSDIKDKHSLKNKEELMDAIKNVSLVYETGQKSVYSDIGYILLGMIIKKIDGNLKESLVENVFKKMDMNDTGYLPTKDSEMIVPTEYKEQQGGLLRGNVNDYKAYLLNGVSGHAGLFSSLNDLNKFVSMYLNDGKYNDQEIIKPQVLEMLNQHYQESRTLGWQEWTPDSLNIWHSGFTGTSIALNLKDKQGFVCLTNRVYPDRSKTNWIKTRRLAIGLFFDEPEVIR